MRNKLWQSPNFPINWTIPKYGIIMKKLTRYTEFNTLKQDNKSTNENVKVKDKLFHEFEDFIKLLRSKLQAGKKITNRDLQMDSNLSNGGS